MENLQLLTSRDKTLNALQQIQLEGLKEIDRICRKYDIKYSLGGGTCLGQLRHNGFIPWDDDIDVDMTADNYDKFINIALKELDTNRFFLRCRKTDKNHLRSLSRLEIKFTTLESQDWDKKKISSGIFIDIFKLSYMPNNPFLRKIISSCLFYIRCAENYKMFHKVAKKAKHKLLVILMGKFIPKHLLFFIEDRLTSIKCKSHTNWLLDDAIINGNHGGFPSQGIDTYKDVLFEGITVMNKKEPMEFMKTLYGNNCMNWLPPVKRISHHKWFNLDFGVYKHKFDLPENYSEYLTLRYTNKKLEHMKNISLKMAQKVSQICNENNIKYYLLGIDSYIKGNNVDECGKLWYGPIKIAMPRKDYNKFAEISQKYLGKQYFYQSYKTDKEYKYSYARIRLNLTSIRESKTPKYIEEKYNNGFFIEIIPLENTSNDAKQRKKHIKKIKRLNHFILLKWKRNNIRFFVTHNVKYKIKLLLLLPFSTNYLIKKLEKQIQKYANIDTDYYVDGSGYQLNGLTIKKDIFGNGSILEYNGYDFSFPVNFKKYLASIDSLINTKKIYKDIKTLKYIKNHFSDSYFDEIEKINKNAIDIIQKKYPNCYLNYFDIPDYQLSILRYDEKENRYLSDEEIINSLN